MIREIIVIAFISAFIRIYPAKITQSMAMKPNCVLENVRFAIIACMCCAKLIKKGVDSHPHLLQRPIERVNEKLILLFLNQMNLY